MPSKYGFGNTRKKSPVYKKPIYGEVQRNPIQKKMETLPGIDASPMKHAGKPGAKAHTHAGPVTEEQSKKGVTPGSEKHRSYVSVTGSVPGKEYKTTTSTKQTTGRTDYVTKKPSYKKLVISDKSTGKPKLTDETTTFETGKKRKTEETSGGKKGSQN